MARESTNLGKKITYARRAAGLSQRELGVRSDICNTTIWLLESGKLKGVKAATLNRIANVLLLPMEFFIDDKFVLDYNEHGVAINYHTNE